MNPLLKDLQLLVRSSAFSEDETTTKALSIISSSSLPQPSLFCPSCAWIFSNPVALECGHTFCRKCLIEATEQEILCPACGLVPQHPMASYGTLITLDNLPQNEELLQTHGQHQALCQQAELDSPESLALLGQCIGLAPYWWKPYAIATSHCINQGCVEVALEYAVAGLLRATCKTRLTQLAKFVLLKLQSPLNQLLFATEKIVDQPANVAMPMIPFAADQNLFECPLCCDVLMEPIVMQCGHTFCKSCLARAIDHNPLCPICRAQLPGYIDSAYHPSNAIVNIMMDYLQNEFAERKRAFDQEQEEERKYLPLFVCAVAMPTVSCPLHIFEPRYRLMLRRCLSGNREFGMVPTLDGDVYGTTLFVRDATFLPDGRSLVDTIGRRRFRVLELSARDSYAIAKVEWLEDAQDAAPATTEAMHQTVRAKVTQLWQSLPQENRESVEENFGSVPAGAYELSFWITNLLPLSPMQKYSIMKVFSLPGRLAALNRVLDIVLRQLHE